MAPQESIVDRLDRTCRPVVEGLGFELILVEWTTDQGRRVLRLYIDQAETGATVEDCATVSRRISHVLDVEDFINSAYSLEVSTPGLNRPLVSETDFVRFAGQVVRVTLREPLPTGRKRLKGTLQGVDAGEVSMEVDGQTFRFGLTDVARANLVYQGEI